MTETLAQVAERHRSVAATFGQRVDAVTDWDAATPVPEWRTRDVVAHLVEWPRALFGPSGVAFGDIPDVRLDPAAAWHAHSEQVQAVLADPATEQLVLDSDHFPGMPLLQAIATFYLPDVFMHTWDLATASGQPSGLDQATCRDMLQGMEQQEEMLRASGQFGTRQPVADDATPEQRLMAFVGRDPQWRPAG